MAHMNERRYDFSKALQLYMAEHGPAYPWTIGKEGQLQSVRLGATPLVKVLASLVV